MIQGGVRIDTDLEWVWDILFHLYILGKLTGNELWKMAVSIGTLVDSPIQ